MSGFKKSGWNDFQQLQNDSNTSSVKRPKLDIFKNNLSQSSKVKVADKSSEAGAETSRTIRRTNSLPSKPSPPKASDVEFIDIVQEEFDAIEAKALAAAADAVEYKMAQASRTDGVAAGMSKIVPPSNPAPEPQNYRNNGSSGFENLFADELAMEDVEEMMELASQEIQASQKKHGADNSAYNIFSKEVNAHSSLMEQSFKKPPQKAHSLKPPQITKPRSEATGTTTSLARPLQSSTGCIQNVKPTTMNPQAQNVKPTTMNPQAEVEVRRLSLQVDKILSENKQLKETLKTKEGEVSILRTKLKKSDIDARREKTESDKKATTSEQQYGKKLKDMEAENEKLRMKLEFEKAEHNAAQQRLTLLTQNNQQIRLVQPSTSTQGAPLPSPKGSSQRQRSTFEEKPQSTKSRKQLNLAEDGGTDRLLLQATASTHEIQPLVKPEMKTVQSQTVLSKEELDDITLEQDSLNASVCERLTEKLSGLQLVSDSKLEHELFDDRNVDVDDLETIPTFSLLDSLPKSKKRRYMLEEKGKPRLINCSKNLRSLTNCNDPTTPCATEKAALLQIFQESCGIIHHHLFLLQDQNDSLTDKKLRERDEEIILHGREVLPLHKDFDLLDEKLWHKDECGVEVRRSLGLLTELAAAFPFGAMLLTGQCEITISKHKFAKRPEYVGDNVTCDDSNFEEQFWFLKVLCDICLIIVRQKCTIALSGMLAGILALLKTCAQKKAIFGENEIYVLSIIRAVLLTRPPSLVLLYLVDLLNYCSTCEEIMKGLCTNCDDEDVCCEDTSAGTCTFSKNTCALQVLCIQLTLVTEPCCWRLVDSLLRWLSRVVSQGWGAPYWILSSPQSSHFPCCTLLLSTLVSLLWDTFEAYQIVEEGDLVNGHATLRENVPIENDNALYCSFPRIMRRAIGLFSGLLRNNMFEYMAHVEGSYELILYRLSRMSNLGLTPALQKELAVLVGVEQETTKAEISKDKQVDVKYATAYWNLAAASLKLSP